MDSREASPSPSLPLVTLAAYPILVLLSSQIVVGLALNTHPNGSPLKVVALHGTAQAMCVMVLLLVSRTGFDPHRSLSDWAGMKSRRPRAWIPLFLVGLFLQVPLGWLGHWGESIFPLGEAQQQLRDQLTHPQTPQQWLTVVWAVVLMAPLAEEVLFRGLLLQNLPLDPWLRVTLTAAAFAVVHQHPSTFAYTFVAGVLLAIVALRLGGTLSSVFMHAGVNSAPLVAYASGLLPPPSTS